MRKKQDLHRIGIYKLEDVLQHIVFERNQNPTKLYEDYEVKMNSARYQLFATKGLICVICGIVGQYFALEQAHDVFRKGSKSAHFNLYAIDDIGDEVLMTKDHINPKVNGGSESLENLQTMCCICNEERGLNYQRKFQQKLIVYNCGAHHHPCLLHECLKCKNKFHSFGKARKDKCIYCGVA